MIIPTGTRLGPPTDARFPRAAGTWGWGERQSFFVNADRRIRRPIPTTRHIAVLSLVGGAGASTIAAGVATLAARRRGGPVLAVDAAGSRHGLAARLGRPESERVTALDTAGEPPASFADATRDLPRDGTLSYLGLGHPASDSWPSDPSEWRDAVAPIARFFPVVVTDWGRRRDLRVIAEIARSSHAVCLVAPADRDGVENAASLAAAISRDDARPDTEIVLVDRAREGAAATRVKLHGLDTPVSRIRFDAWLAEGSAPRRRTRRSLLELGSVLVGGRGDADEGDA
ncbi:hypothetical protein [Microbacterium arborescens]